MSLIHERVRARGESIAVAESLTGGELLAEISALAGASSVLRGGVVAYQDRIKIDVLGVSARDISEHGVVSAEVARAMAAGVASKFMAEWGVATTGVAGPGLIDALPVGSAFVAVVGPSFSEAVRFSFDGNRAEIRRACVVSALNLLKKALD